VAFIVILIACVVVGALAQQWKGRTGAGWGALTLLLILPTWYFFYISIASVQASLLRQDHAWLALTLIVCLLVGGILTLIIVTLPRRAKAVAEPEAVAVKKCPQCAETVKADAKICHFCRHELAVLVMLLVVLLTGCASVPMASREADQSAKRFRPTPGYAAIYIVRDVTNWTALVEAAPVWVDGHRIGGLPVKGYFALDVSPGSHRVTTESPEHFRSVTVSAGSGECAFVVISPGSDGPLSAGSSRRSPNLPAGT